MVSALTGRQKTREVELQDAQLYALLVVCINSVYILHRFLDLSTFTVHLTACDLEKSVNFGDTMNYSKHAFRLY